MFDVVEIFRYLYKKDRSYMLLFLVYADEGENISPRWINKLKRFCKETLPQKSFLIIDNPVKNINKYSKNASFALYKYRYIGDIPECPLTIIELLKIGVPVFANKFMALEEYLGNKLVYSTNASNEEVARVIESAISSGGELFNKEEFDEKFCWDNFVDQILNN